MNKIICLFLILFLLFSKLAFAFSDISGEYMIKLKGVDGGIEIKAKEKDKFEFELNTVTGGWYTCNVEGVATFIEKNRAIFRDEEGCLITFTFKNNQIDLKTQNCSIYCGLNGIMDGKYVKKLKKKEKDEFKNRNWVKFASSKDNVLELFYDKDSVAPSVGGSVFITTKLVEKGNDIIIADLSVNCGSRNSPLDLIYILSKRKGKWVEDSPTNPELKAYTSIYRNSVVIESLHEIVCR